MLHLICFGKTLAKTRKIYTSDIRNMPTLPFVHVDPGEPVPEIHSLTHTLSLWLLYNICH